MEPPNEADQLDSFGCVESAGWLAGSQGPDMYDDFSWAPVSGRTRPEMNSGDLGAGAN